MKPTHRAIALLLSAPCLVLSILPVATAQTSSLTNVSQTVFNCMKRNTSGIGGWIEYDGSNSGRIDVYAAAVGHVGAVNYSLDASQNVLSLTYVRGPAPFNQIRGGLEDTANRCRNGELD